MKYDRFPSAPVVVGAFTIQPVNTTACLVVWHSGARQPATITEVELAVEVERLRAELAAALDAPRRTGKAGGHARALALTPEQRTETARSASRARWSTERVRAHCPECGGEYLTYVPRDGDGSVRVFRRHKGANGEQCAGSLREAPASEDA